MTSHRMTSLGVPSAFMGANPRPLHITHPNDNYAQYHVLIPWLISQVELSIILR